MGPVKRNGVLERPVSWNKAATSGGALLRISFTADSMPAFPVLHEIAQSSLRPPLPFLAFVSLFGGSYWLGKEAAGVRGE